MNERQKLMRQIQETGFCVHEAVLFLDTHPNNKKAMEYYRRMQSMLESLTAKYEKNYGPLTAAAVKSEGWNWINSPWPWQNESEA